MRGRCERVANSLNFLRFCPSGLCPVVRGLSAPSLSSARLSCCPRAPATRYDAARPRESPRARRVAAKRANATATPAARRPPRPRVAARGGTSGREGAQRVILHFSSLPFLTFLFFLAWLWVHPPRRAAGVRGRARRGLRDVRRAVGGGRRRHPGGQRRAAHPGWRPHARVDRHVRGARDAQGHDVCVALRRRCFLYATRAHAPPARASVQT